MAASIDNLLDIKSKNLKSIISYMRFHNANTKKQVASDLGLSFATVSNMVNDLITHGLIEICDGGHEKSVGRSPKYITLNKNRYYSVILDLHLGERVIFAIVNLGREKVASKEAVYENVNTIDDFLAFTAKAYVDFIREHGVRQDEIIGICCAIPGIFDAESDRVVSCEQHLFSGEPLRQQLEQIFRKDVIVENDASICAFHAASTRSCSSCVYLFLGEGVGIGTIMGGTILRGARGYSSEVGTAPLGRMNTQTGRLNPLQDDLAFAGFLRRYSQVDRRYGVALEHEWKLYNDRVREGDARAVEVALENAALLGRVLAVACGLFWPERVVLGGVSPELFNLMKPAADHEMNAIAVTRTLRYDLEYDPNYFDSILFGGAEMVYDAWRPTLY